jgi:tetratricopeptide (TPR) repeat protein
MDLTTLAAAMFLALGLIGADAVIHAGSIVSEVTSAPQMSGETIDQKTLEAEFDDQLFQISHVQSVVNPPEIRTSHDQGLGMALAQAVDAAGIAYALQAQFGYAPDRLRLALYLEHGELRGQVSGITRNIGTFRQVITPYKDEPLLPFVRRCALWSASRIAPYATALYLLQKHSTDKDFTDVFALIDHTKSELPPTPVSFDKSVLDNLRGIALLFQNKPAAAQEAFDLAMAEDPSNPVAEINAAFADLQLDKYQQGTDRMRSLIHDRPPANKMLLATAYMTLAAAEMGGLHNLPEADRMLAKATELAPDSAAAFYLWAELKGLQGDNASAARYERQAQLNTATFENYGEVAALYFHLSWRNNEAVTLSKFTNPTIVSFH